MRLIDGDALKEQYENHRKLYCKNRIEFKLLSEKDKARVDELDSCIADILNAPTIEPERKWIPCSERLPEMTHFTQDVNPFSDDVLVTIRNEYGSKCLLIGFFDSQHGWLFSDQQPIDGFTWKPIAWQPLPDPYKKEGDRNE